MPRACLSLVKMYHVMSSFGNTRKFSPSPSFFWEWEPYRLISTRLSCRISWEGFVGTGGHVGTESIPVGRRKSLTDRYGTDEIQNIGPGHQRTEMYLCNLWLTYQCYYKHTFSNLTPASDSKPTKKRAASPESTTSPSRDTKRTPRDISAPERKEYFPHIIGGNSTSEGKISSQNAWKKLFDGKILMYTSVGVVGRDKVAAYDLDGTLITTKSGRVFPKDSDDWQIAFAEVPGKLKELWKNGYKIVIFTNQAGIESGRLRVEDFKSKVNRIVQRLGVPIQLFACIVSSGLYRKPAPGMWSILEEMNDGVPLSQNAKDHMYIGDAAGRGRDGIGASKPARGSKKPKKDFSCSDRLFALNLGLSFFTPEEHFLKRPTQAFSLPAFNPALAVKEAKNCPVPALTSNRKEVVVMVGGPGSGKSYASKNYLKGYAWVCRDELGTREKCETVARGKLSAGLSVVFDCTHPEKASRSRVVSLAKVAGVPIRCFLMMTTKDQAKHNNKFREITDPSHMKINEMVINSYYSKFEEPTMDEGFEEIVQVKFLPRFDDAKLEKLYSMYLIDK